MIMSPKGCTVPLYRERGQGIKLVLASYNWRVLILLQNLTFLVSQLGQSGKLEVHATLSRVPQ
jgi:hypothetical protein